MRITYAPTQRARGERARASEREGDRDVEMSGGGGGEALRLHDQLRAVWKRRGADAPSARGYLLLPPHTTTASEGGEKTEEVAERWFVLVGHCFFYTIHRESPEFSGALLADIFGPVTNAGAAADEEEGEVLKKVFSSSPDSPAKTELSHSLHLKASMVSGIDIVVCPESVEDRNMWLDKLRAIGLNITKATRPNGGAGMANGDMTDTPAPHGPVHSHSNSEVTNSVDNYWRRKWQHSMRKVLSLPDATQAKKRAQVIAKLVSSESRYVGDLSILTDQYYQQVKLAVTAGLIALASDVLDTIFLNCETLLSFHRLFLEQLRSAESRPEQLVGAIVVTCVNQMKMYCEFVRNHKRSLLALEDCLSSPTFTAFMENYHWSHDCEAQQLKQLLYAPTTRLDIYLSFIEEILRHTNDEHIDHRPLKLTLNQLQIIKQEMSRSPSNLEQRERMLDIIAGVGPRGFLLIEPDCYLVLEGDMFLPPSTKWGSSKQRPIHCFLYSNALVVIASEKKTKYQSQMFPLAGASVYEHISKNGAVTIAKDPDLEVKALKIYSPDGPRNGVIVTFSTQSAKGLWLAKISETIMHCTFYPDNSHTPSPPVVRRAASVLALNITSSAPLSPLPPSTPTHPSSPISLSPAGSRPNSLHNGRGSPLQNQPLSQPSQSPQPATPSELFPRSNSMVTLLTPTHPLIVQKPHVYSLPTLFSKLANPPSPHFPSIFLLTYRMFTNAHEVLDSLIEGHQQEMNKRRRRDVAVSAFSLRFFNTLKMWASKYYVDFHHDVTLKRVLVVYLNNIKKECFIHDKECELVEGILRLVNQRGHIPLTRKSKLKLQIPKSQRTTPTSLMEVNASDVAVQLTWVEHMLYSRIKPYELLQQKWTKKNRTEVAPNICYVINRFNQMTLWVAKEILTQDSMKQRCAVIQRMLDICKTCLKLNNYVTVFQITSALISTPLQRLRKTWDLLPPNAVDQLVEFKRLCSVDGVSRVYRERQRGIPAPSVPYMGPYLNQLITIEVGMQTFVKDPPEHVNFTKLERLASVIEEVTRFQNPMYNLEPDGAVLAYLDGALEAATSFDDEQQYSLSMAIEPKQERRGSKARLH